MTFKGLKTSLFVMNNTEIREILHVEVQRGARSCYAGCTWSDGVIHGRKGCRDEKRNSKGQKRKKVKEWKRMCWVGLKEE
jgi:hypothetical protein